MLNPTQQASLNSYIGEEGFYFDGIRDNEAFNLGTKILYLERAINQNCQSFLQSLDKLYHPNLSDEAKAANIEFIRSLKMINDLCFNHEVKYGEFGTRKALMHFFGSLGHVDPGDFQTTIQRIVHARIVALQEGHAEEIAMQKAERETAEAHIGRRTGWREELDLPVFQLSRQIKMPPILDDVFTNEQFQQLSEEIKDVIANSSIATHQLIKSSGATFSQIQALNPQELEKLLQNRFAIERLVYHDIPFNDILALDEDIRVFVLMNHEAIIQLVNDVHVPLSKILALDEDIRTLVIRKYFAIKQLVNHAHVSFYEILTLDNGIRAFALEKPLEISRLVQSAHVSFRNILALNEKSRAFIIKKYSSILQLVRLAHIPFKDLLALNEEIRALIIEEYITTIILTNKPGVTFKRLVSLSIEDLSTVLTAPNSPEAQNILRPSSSADAPCVKKISDRPYDEISAERPAQRRRTAPIPPFFNPPTPIVREDSAHPLNTLNTTTCLNQLI